MLALAHWRNPVLSGRIPELDGIRGLAILMVLIFHYVVDAVREDTVHVAVRSWLAYAVFPLRLSWSGLDLFFVLSGFLIGGILVDTKFSTGYYRAFYMRRFHRILPLYFIWLVLFIAASATVNSKAGPLYVLLNHEIPTWSYFLFLQNIFTAFTSKWGAAWMGMTWSLALEEQFYLLLPVTIRKVRPHALVWTMVGAILIAPVLRVVLNLAGNNFFGPFALLPCRADSLGMGVLLAIACRNGTAWGWLVAHRKSLQIACVALGCGVGVLNFFPKGYVMNSIGFTAVAAFYASFLVVVLLNPGRVVRTLLGSTLLLTLGDYAYGIYIFHEAVNGLCHYFLRGERPSIYNLPAAGVTLLSLMIVTAMAAASWRYFESPLIRRSHAKYRYAAAPKELVASAAG